MTGNKRAGRRKAPTSDFTQKKLMNQNRESTVKVVVCERQTVQFNTRGEGGSFFKSAFASSIQIFVPPCYRKVRRLHTKHAARDFARPPTFQALGGGTHTLPLKAAAPVAAKTRSRAPPPPQGREAEGRQGKSRTPPPRGAAAGWGPGHAGRGVERSRPGGGRAVGRGLPPQLARAPAGRAEARRQSPDARSQPRREVAAVARTGRGGGSPP